MSNEKLREALQAVIAAHEAGMREIGERMRAANQTSVQIEGQALLDVFAAIELAREALALPTADHLPDARKMIETAAPVGEREAFERTMMDKYGWQRNDFKLDDFGYFDGHTDTAWMAWQARAALSAGDAVDAARYRWLADCLNYHEAIALMSDGSLTADALGKAIDAAMRKDKL